MNPVQTDFLNIADIRTACHTAGDPNGKPLLLLHGGGADHALLSWQEVMQLWPENGYRLIAPDLPGYGQSAVPDKDYTLDFYSGFISLLLTELRISRVSLCGLSLGGGIALQFALNHQNLTDKLVLVAPWGISPALPWKRFGAWYARSPLSLWLYRLCASRWLTRQLIAASLFGDRQRIGSGLVEAVRSASLLENAGKAFQSFQIHEIYGGKPIGHLLSQLPTLNRPVLLIHGENDPGVPLADARMAAEALPDARLTVFEGHKHWPQKESLRRFAETVQVFLRETV